MSGEPGGGDALLRARLRKFAEPAKCEDVDDWTAYTDEVLGALLAEIAAAGMVIVPADRYERLRLFGGRMFADEFSDCAEWRNWQNAGLQPGDLEPLDPVAPGEGQS